MLQATLRQPDAMATTQPRIFTFSKGGGSKGDKSMKELVSTYRCSASLCCCLGVQFACIRLGNLACPTFVANTILASNKML